MKDEDIQNLLGGFATDTLTDRERELLFTASLTNQELFNALADDQALRELLSDPAARRQLLQALQPSRPGLFERLTGWMWRPAAWAVAGSVMAGLVVAVAIRQSPRPAMEVAKPAPPAQSVPSPAPVEPAVQPMAPRSAAQSEEKRAVRRRDEEAKPAAEPSPKLKVAVLDFDSRQAPAKDVDAASADVGKTASDLLGKKLDSSRYTIIDRKEVDKALQDQNLSRRELDASTAASVGRSVGADAVITGSVTEKQQTAQKSSGAAGELRSSAPSVRATMAAKQSEVQVKAQAINTQTAGNLAVAFGQAEQTPGGGLARAVDQVASSLGQQIQQNSRIKIDGLVTDVNASILTVNVGLKAGVKMGDRLEVRRAGKPIGRVVISTVKDSFSVGAFEGAGPAKIGDGVANQAPLP
jgi:curli biogenesis system outer membrane secretion channel CsgG